MEFIVIFTIFLRTTFGDTTQLPEIKQDHYQINDHLKIEHIQKLCSHRQQICRSEDKNLCGFRITSKMEYVDFNNSCYLFMANMCEHPGNEYYIITSGKCAEYLSTRRMNILRTAEATTAKTSTANEKPKLRTPVKPKTTQTTFQTLYDIDTAFDYHTCPLSCPDVYSPVCVGVNRGFGLYYKFYTFVNHCAGDLYYCKNWREFSPPPDEDEMVRSSPLSWSFCAANRYIQFARFSEMTYSMGHYGWLAGDYSPSHIMRPHERQPGYG